ncbi:uncharacterized protein BYT42DRAFT_600693 [Radiomyces spectabilis]|uniref:uncharacterized protein n=1 Tax=Radiomyces spectabilis TaxID=64574 RepID=UPI00221EC4BF|nr:uncharacterized protein BYT42DRAFT_600693 [Radiomyces spectabilis]KAI8365943.1 hypothetical protein BYT42DRAFT_600693 [Radiomyces spectabilis]
MVKPGKQPRVKGNLKPASSSRAADLAASAATPLTFQNLGAFAQFAGASPALALHTSRPGTPTSSDGLNDTNPSSQLDPELIVIIKKTSKRDSVTKLKALEEFEAYLNGNPKTISAILPTWVSMYVKLAIDVDRRVRLATNNVHMLITVHAKKKLAPFLKGFIATWLICIFDPSKDVARAAKKAFESVFAEDKRAGAIAFCQKEILDVLNDMILQKTPETLSDARYVSKDDMEAKFARVVSASFYSLAHLIETLALEERQKCIGDYDGFFDNSEFWKYVSHDNPLIRRSVYHLIKVLLLQWEDVLLPRLEKICPGFFTAVFTEKEASTHADMWDAVLLLTKTFPESWLVASKKKPILPKLYAFLRMALNGSVNISYPSLLALCANLPNELKDAPSFYKDLFSNFWKGLHTDTFDKSNAHLFFNAYMECIVYFAVNQSKKTDDQVAQNTVTDLMDIFWEAVQIFFVGSRSRVEEKLNVNTTTVIAKHLAVVAAIPSMKDYMSGFWSNLDLVFCQTVIDCKAPTGEMDMGEFSLKVVHFLDALCADLKSTSTDTTEACQSQIGGIVRRLLTTSLESSLVHKDKSPSLLQLAYHLLSRHARFLFHSSSDDDKIVHLCKLLLALLADGPRESISPLFAVYTAVLIKIPGTSQSKDLWNTVMAKLVTMADETASLDDKLQQANALIALLEQCASLNLDSSYQCSDLDILVHRYSIHQSTWSTFSESSALRFCVERVTELSLLLHLSFDILSKATADSLYKELEMVMEKFTSLYYAYNEQTKQTDNISQLFYMTEAVLGVLKHILNRDHLLSLLQGPFRNLPQHIFDAMFMEHVLSASSDNEQNQHLANIVQLASSLWKEMLQTLEGQEAQVTVDLRRAVLQRVHSSISDIRCSSSPYDSVQRVKRYITDLCSHDSTARQEALDVFFGDSQKWKDLSSVFELYSSEYLGLSVTDRYAALVQSQLVDSDELPSISYDLYGLSAYARHILFVTEYILDVGVHEFFFANDDQDWMLQQLMTTSIECRYGLEMRGLCRIWNHQATESYVIMETFVQHAETIYGQWVESAVSLSCSNEWMSLLYHHLQANENIPSEERLLLWTADLVKSIPKMTNDVEDTTSPQQAAAAQLLEQTLTALLKHCQWDPASLNLWLDLVKNETLQVHLLAKFAIIMAIKDHIGDTQSFRNLQSDLTSKLSSVTTMEALEEETNSKAWSYMVLLNATSLKFGGISIPPQRLMHLVLSIRKWFEPSSAEDNLSTLQRIRVSVQLAQLCMNIAETIQDVSGGQWDFFLQRCYEWAAFSDASTPEELPVIYYAVLLYQKLQDLAVDGTDELSCCVKEHASSMGNALLKLLANERAAKEPISRPRQAYQELLADVHEHIPEKVLLSHVGFMPDFSALLNASNVVIQQRAYSLLRGHVQHTAQELSVNLEFNATNEQEVSAEIEKHILHGLQQAPNLSKWHTSEFGDEELHTVLGYMLSWQLMFDHFKDITFKLKQEYTEQLKESNVVDPLLRNLFRILGVGAGQEAVPFDLHPWDITTYDIEGFDATSELSYVLLASHLYYRALVHIPSLVRLWWVDCKNRQLTIAVQSYTEKHFSSRLIANELDLLIRPDIKTQLEDNDDNEFSVKAMKAANEVSATYRVDEQDMQIVIKLPANYPLRQIDVEGVQKVGVNDKQWRGWILAITSIIGSQNGNIVDALTIFKRNANLHFAGVEDCTICYSIISAQDRSIPSKQCRTCKHKFHASCLYKWFRSSNSASCPLCRTVF